MTPLSTHIPRIDTARLVLRGHEAGDFDRDASLPRGETPDETLVYRHRRPQ